MTSRKFFSVLWRVNAIVIFIVGLLGSAGLGALLVMVIREQTRERHASDVLNVVDDQVNHVATTLGNFARIEGSQVLRAPLDVEQQYDLSLGSKEASSTQNYLFFDPEHDRSYWLLSDFKGIIRSVESLPEERDPDHPTPVKAVVYELIERDTNGDGKLTEHDHKAIVISDPVGTQVIRVLNDVESFNSVHLLTDGTQAVVFYTSQATARAARIDMATGKVLNEIKLTPLKGSTPPAAAVSSSSAVGVVKLARVSAQPRP